jgi:hypothetical protein
MFRSYVGKHHDLLKKVSDPPVWSTEINAFGFETSLISIVSSFGFRKIFLI